MKLSLSGFLFEDDYRTQSVTLAAFCGIARSAGYEGVELRGTQVDLPTPKAERQRILRVVRDHGLSVTCLTARGMPKAERERDDFFERYLDLCVDLGCRLLKIGSDITWLRSAAQKAQAAGVALATNNHAGTVLETVAGTRQYLRDVGHPNFGLLYDPYHLMTAGQDYVGCLAELVPWTRNILVQSARRARPGEPADAKGWAKALADEPGVQDWRSIFREFRRAGYDGLVTVIENNWPVERREEVARRSATAIRRFWDEGKTR